MKSVAVSVLNLSLNHETYGFYFPFLSFFLSFVRSCREICEQDAGLYRITVENELGRIQANARLDILGRTSSSRSTGFIRSGSAATAARGNHYTALGGASSRLIGRTLGLSGASSYLRGSSTPRSGGGRYL